jgi:hypothetical protein
MRDEDEDIYLGGTYNFKIKYKNIFLIIDLWIKSSNTKEN